MKGFLKYLLLFAIACICSIVIYQAVIPEEQRVPFSIEIEL